MVNAAPCLLWQAEIEDLDGGLCWRAVRLVDEDAADRFLPLERAPGEAYLVAFRRARHPEDETPNRRYVTEQIRSGRTHSHEFRVRARDGEYRWCSERIHVES